MRSVSHCGQTISLYTPHQTWCWTSYTKSTKREITSQRLVLSRGVSFPFLQINGKAWVEESCVLSRLPSSDAPEHEQRLTRLRHRVVVFFFSFNIPKSYPRSSTWAGRSSQELLAGRCHWRWCRWAVGSFGVSRQGRRRSSAWRQQTPCWPERRRRSQRSCCSWRAG